jgi:hypothetical protein
MPQAAFRETRLPPYALISDVPPAKTGGYGSQVLSWNWAEAVGEDLKLVVTHRQHPALSKEQVVQDLRPPVLFYPDLTRVRFRRRVAGIKSLTELMLGLLWVPRIVSGIRRNGAQRIFAFVSNSAWFLPIADQAARRAGLPLDYYLVDDLEESARMWRHPVQARLVRWLEPRMLRRASRVFTISPGYGEHLLAKYQVRSKWLPIAVRQMSLEHHPYEPTSPDVRPITFIGGVSSLYAEGLKDCLRVIEAWNRQPHPFRLRLLVMTYTPPAVVARDVGVHPDLEVLIRPPSDEFRRRMQASWAIFVPYSFGPAERIMVTCSFPTKLTDAVLAGRPLLVYGPAYASLPRYFSENQLPLCVVSRDGLAAAIHQIRAVDSAALIARYQSVVRSFHSPDRLRQTLAVEPASSVTEAGAGPEPGTLL